MVPKQFQDQWSQLQPNLIPPLECYTEIAPEHDTAAL